MATLTIHLEKSGAEYQVRYSSERLGFHPPPWPLGGPLQPQWQTIMRESPSWETLQAIGKAMSQTLFPLQARDYIGPLRNQVDRLRLRLFIEDPAWQQVPWEALWDWYRDDFFAHDIRTPIVRLTASQLPTRQAQLGIPLRVVLAAASPIELPSLGIDTLLPEYQAILDDLLQQGLLKLQTVPQATRDTLNRAVLKMRPHIVHLIVHGNSDGKDDLLILANEQGHADAISARTLHSLIDHPATNLIILAACKSAGEATADLNWDQMYGLAGYLLRHEVPCVLGMHGSVSNVIATVIERKFFEILCDTETKGDMETAITRTRRFLAHHRLAQPKHWLHPVFFSQGTEALRVPGNDEQTSGTSVQINQQAKYITNINQSNGPIHIGDRCGPDDNET